MAEFLTVGQVADALGVIPCRVRQLIAQGLLPGAQRIGRDWLIPPAALDTARARKRKPGRVPKPRP